MYCVSNRTFGVYSVPVTVLLECIALIIVLLECSVPVIVLMECINCASNHMHRTNLLFSQRTDLDVASLDNFLNIWIYNSNTVIPRFTSSVYLKFAFTPLFYNKFHVTERHYVRHYATQLRHNKRTWNK